MSLSSPPPPPPSSWKATLSTILVNISDDPTHPVQIALRTYSLCFSLSLGPALIPLIFALPNHQNSFRARATVFWRALLNELEPTGFASAITAAVGGGAALQRLWNLLEHRYVWTHCIDAKSSKRQRAFFANVVTSTLAITLLRRRRLGRPRSVSPTLDLTLLFFLRALDASIQTLLLKRVRKNVLKETDAISSDGLTVVPSEGDSTLSDTGLLDGPREDLIKERHKKAATHLDALIFWISSARIMWCFFYQPQRLPLSYVKWISSLANVNKGLLEVLRALRSGSWSYIHGSPQKGHIIGRLAVELGRPASWGDPDILPACGGEAANEVWKQLGVSGRCGIGGLPCELVHGGVGAMFGLQNSCIANAIIRAIYAFAEALVIYLPVHFLPALLIRPRIITRPRHALSAFVSAIRSATFLSTFISSYWYAVCFTRTLVLARLFPNISHDVWDGPRGCILAGSLVCGASIWIENARRKGEIALYVLPKAFKACIPDNWLRSRHPGIQLAECLTFVLSLASLLTSSVHQPESLRGLSRWTLAFVMRGPNSGLSGPWKRRRGEIAPCYPTISSPPQKLIPAAGKDHSLLDNSTP